MPTAAALAGAGAGVISQHDGTSETHLDGPGQQNRCHDATPQALDGGVSIPRQRQG
jgi:hypothetical protein